MNDKLLDIIVTHYDEPWEVCSPFFTMLSMQRGIDFSGISVIVVQNSDVPCDWLEDVLNEHFRLPDGSAIPYTFLYTDSENTHPRNVGLDAGNADWVMFCDIDDMFADVSSLRMILDQLPVENYDMIWTKYVEESMWDGQHIQTNCVDEANMSSVTGKLYRRQFLTEKNIRFTGYGLVQMYSDYIFNALVIAESQPFRIVSLTTSFYVYCKTYRQDGLSHRMSSVGPLIHQRFGRDVYLAQEFHNRSLQYAGDKAALRALLFEYYQVYSPYAENAPDVCSQWAQNYYAENRDAIVRLSPSEVDVVRDDVEVEMMNLVQRIYNDHCIEFYPAYDACKVSFEDWMSFVKTPIQKAPSEPGKRVPKIAVYCGTRNTYMNMLTAAKSLLYNTPMDKVYFLIEDGQFPYELPGIIECINVHDQTYFPQDGPNYNNAWSYMCMMRAAFSKIIPYDVVLSLDIDTIVQEDISPLWDIDLGNNLLAGVPEPGRMKAPGDPPYINFGVALMNLAQIRAEQIDDTIISALNTNRYGCPEQDAFNQLCAGRILPVLNDYNATVHSHITGDAQTERIIHYAGIKFWRHYGAVREYSEKSWEKIMERQNALKAGGNDEG